MRNKSNKKVGWLCTYTPEEIIHAAGFTPVRLLPGSGAFTEGSEDLLPPNICPYPRRILSTLRSGILQNMEGVVVANSCNAMLHLYNVLRTAGDFFVYLLDVPRKLNDQAVDYFTGELIRLADYLGGRGQPVTAETLASSLSLYRERAKYLQKLTDLQCYDLLLSAFPSGYHELAVEASGLSPEIFTAKLKRLVEKYSSGCRTQQDNRSLILFAGGLISDSLSRMLDGRRELIVYPENCSGMRYLLKKTPFVNPDRPATAGELYRAISRACLEKPPCPRIFNTSTREKYFRNLLDTMPVKGVIYHDLIFCDLCHYDYLLLQDLLAGTGIPLLKVKTELGEEDSGQLQTRVEAFLEIVSQEEQ
ncbi:MAG: 2-hydroxyacyl-CoA dehydratase family protein [Bacillota bacterium]|nr:2-hydroxyacyl-CoA dehydratase family protein [Bacillota bacterium]